MNREHKGVYVAHKWVASDEDAYCQVCGITESNWKRRIQKSSMIDNDCAATQDRLKR